MLTEKFFAIAQIGHEFTLWVLVILSILSVAFILERYFSLKATEAKSNAASKQMQDSLQANALNEVEDIAKDRESVVGKALSYGLRHAKENGTDGLEEIFNSYALMEKPKLEKRLSFLATVGSNAPFIGLLGTVFGIMDAFSALANSQGEMQAVMSGISEALVATAVGLLVAIPAVVAYNFLQRKVKAILNTMESAKDFCLAYSKAKKGA